MATISKTTSGKFKAIVKGRGRVLRCKTFSRKTDARAWAKRVEADADLLAAYGSRGATMTFTELVEEYLRQWQGKDVANQVSRLSWLVDQIGNCKLTDIDADAVRDVVGRYASGKARLYAGVGADLRTRSKDSDRPRAMRRKQQRFGAVAKVGSAEVTLLGRTHAVKPLARRVLNSIPDPLRFPGSARWPVPIEICPVP